MTDDELDRRLREAMAVAPAPDLAARVRTAVAARSAAGQWSDLRPILATCGLLLAASLALVITWRSGPSPGAAPRQTPTERASRGQSPRLSAPEPERPVPDGRTDRVAPPPRRPRRPAVSAMPLVQLAPGDRDAFRVLLAFSRTATTAPPALELAEPIRALSISALEISPLEVTTIEVSRTSSEGEPK